MPNTSRIIPDPYCLYGYLQWNVLTKEFIDTVNHPATNLLYIGTSAVVIVMSERTNNVRTSKGQFVSILNKREIHILEHQYACTYLQYR